jgi:hypothetical protein
VELTKEQILYIDHRLENEGIKYWDIRIEMLDHVISNVEENLIPENSEYEFKEKVQTAFVTLGWKENFNGGGLDGSDKDALKNVNKEYRKLFFQGFVNFFKSFKNLGFLLCFVMIYYIVSNNINYTTFKRISLVLFLLPMLFFLFYSIKIWSKKYGKSIHLNYGIFYFSFAFMMLNLPIQLLKYTTQNSQKLFTILLIPIYFIATSIGFKVYQKAIAKVEKMRKELLS